MPTYEITIPGSGTYQVESDRPLSDAEAYQAAAANAQPRGVTEQLTRGAGLALRGAAPVATGAAGGFMVGGAPGALAGSLALPIAELGTQAANVMLPEKYQIPSPSSAVEGLLTRLGFPVPETTGERVIQAGGAGLGGFGGQIRGLQALSQTAASPVGRGVAQTMASEPGRQLAAAAPSAMAGQTAYELTGSPVAGMVAGMGTGAAFGVGAKQPGVTREELAAKSTRLFEKAKESGVMFNAPKFANKMEGVMNGLRDEGYEVGGAYPKLDIAFKRLTDPNTPKDFTGLTNLRKAIRSAQASIDPEERRMATILKNEFDDYVANAPSSDMFGLNTKTGTALWKQARDEYSKLMKSDIFEEMLSNAQLDASKFTQSGAENSMAQQLRQLAKNDKKMRMFTKDEQAAIRSAAKGTTVQNLLKFYGRFAPTSPIPAGFAGGASVYEPTIGVPFTLGAMASRAGATKMREQSVQNLADMMRSGITEVPRNLAPAVTGARGLLTPLNVTSEELQQIYGR
jgi:hypothetical protein